MNVIFTILNLDTRYDFTDSFSNEVRHDFRYSIHPKERCIEPDKSFKIEDYEVTPVPVRHSVPAVGFQIRSSTGKELFFTGDTGPEVSECWERINPDVMIIECTASDRFYEFGKRAGHLTTGLLKEVLVEFRELRGYIPQVITVHMSPRLEEEIRTELAVISGELGASIQVGYEGMEVLL